MLLWVSGSGERRAEFRARIFHRKNYAPCYYSLCVARHSLRRLDDKWFCFSGCWRQNNRYSMIVCIHVYNFCFVLLQDFWRRLFSRENIYRFISHLFTILSPHPQGPGRKREIHFAYLYDAWHPKRIHFIYFFYFVNFTDVNVITDSNGYL